MITPPKTITELMNRAEAIAGITLRQLGEEYHSKIPNNQLLEKGWVGQFCEQILGAQAGSLPEPDFPNLGVELKTIPIDTTGKPLESTYVSVVPMGEPPFESWDDSVVKKKLTKVLWLPIISPSGSELLQRQIGMPLLWQPSDREWLLIKDDWEDAMEKVMLGQVDQLNSRFGSVLQVRPKAANSRVLTTTVGPDGSAIQTLPRGFYLRARFTRNVLQQLSY